MRSVGLRFAAALTFCAAAVAPAIAAEFYEGKTLTVLINYPPGGSSDVEGRLVARHLGAHIAGKPNVIVQNMGGAGGLIGANWLGEIAKPDGMTLGYFTATPVKAALGDPALRADLTKFAFVASAPGMQVTFIRSDTPPGIKRPEDIMKAKDFWIGGFTPDSLKDVLERLQVDLLGIKYKYVSAYPGSAEARLALLRNEIQFFSEGIATYRASIEPDLVKSGVVTPLWYDPFDDGVAMHKPADAEGIDALPFDQFLKQQKGAIPEGQLWDAYRLINQLGTTFLRIIVMPPNAPKEAVAAVRAGLVDLAKDAAFRDEAMKTLQTVPRFETEENTEKLFAAAIKPDPKLREFIRTYIDEGVKLAKR
jgi:tripartite-type tricarboxylate transporter receptor subunit TctC